MRLTDEQIIKVIMDEFEKSDPVDEDQIKAATVVAVRRCLALAALPDEQKPYEDVERRGFSVSQPGELPR